MLGVKPVLIEPEKSVPKELATGVNSSCLLNTPNNFAATQSLTIVFVLPDVSVTLATSNPDSP